MKTKVIFYFYLPSQFKLSGRIILILAAFHLAYCCLFLLDILVWSNERVIKWIRSIGLKDYSNNLVESGVHGGVLALDENYNWTALALALEIPIHDTLSRQIIETEYKLLMANRF